MSKCSMPSLIAFVTILFAAAPLAADPGPLAQAGADTDVEDDPGETADEAEEEADEVDETDETDEEQKGDKDSDGEEADEGEQEEDDAYTWKPSWGGGVDAGAFFNGLDRWNANLLDGQAQFDNTALWHIDATAETSLLEGTRFSVFGGLTSALHEDPSLSAWYIGVEPAFAFREGMWEVAIGMGAGLGKTNLTLDEGGGADTGLGVLRPFLEVRHYLDESVGVFARAGFNQWLPFGVDTQGDVEFDPSVDQSAGELAEGGAFLSIGARYGHYPKHEEVGGTGDEENGD